MMQTPPFLRNTMTPDIPNGQAFHWLNDSSVNPRALEMTAIGEYNANTIVYTAANTVVVTIHSPERPDQTRIQRVFMCDRNAKLKACMEFVCEYWSIPEEEVEWNIKKEDAHDYHRVLQFDVIEEVSYIFFLYSNFVPWK